jgi:hypothetical protein
MSPDTDYMRTLRERALFFMAGGMVSREDIEENHRIGMLSFEADLKARYQAVDVDELTKALIKTRDEHHDFQPKVAVSQIQTN